MKITVFVLLMALCQVVTAYDLVGKVVKVADGDTITILSSDKKQHKIRLNQIDAPESNQPWGKHSKESLIKMVANKVVTVRVSGKDRYGRLVGTPYLNNVDICKEQIKRGNAWVYVQYAKDKQLVAIEDEARKNKIGLWSLPESQRIAPWLWRRKK